MVRTCTLSDFCLRMHSMSKDKDKHVFSVHFLSCRQLSWASRANPEQNLQMHGWDSHLCGNWELAWDRGQCGSFALWKFSYDPLLLLVWSLQDSFQLNGAQWFQLQYESLLCWKTLRTAGLTSVSHFLRRNGWIAADNLAPRLGIGLVHLAGSWFQRPIDSVEAPSLFFLN